ncbi:3-methyl-2-oxobutanoate hydroxymethyltransferase [bacterium]|nr:3-methyl-2-oxobutanoate hydroxymethyltransferase [candidate division CSSED10-310 bacterium]
MKRVTVPAILNHDRAIPIVMITAYDAPFARIVDQAGVDIILVGDSVGTAVLGYADTLAVTIDDMVHHIRAVARGSGRCLIVGDMPFGSAQIGGATARKDAVAIMRAGAHAVKLEGSHRLGLIRQLTDNGIPVMGHIGLTPQSIHRFGGYKVQGRNRDDQAAMIDAAAQLENAGVFSIVIECVPPDTARLVTEAISIPTIGIGAGRDVNGQVLVLHDVLGLNPEFKPKFVKHFCNGADILGDAVLHYCEQVRNRQYPGSEHIYGDDRG